MCVVKVNDGRLTEVTTACLSLDGIKRIRKPKNQIVKEFSQRSEQKLAERSTKHGRVKGSKRGPYPTHDTT